MTESTDTESQPDQDKELAAAVAVLNAGFNKPLRAAVLKAPGTFCIHNDQLKNLAKLTRIVGNEQPVLFEVRRDRLRATAKNGVIFTAEAQLDQEAPQSEGVCFALTCRELKSLAEHFTRHLVCRFDVQENYLHVRCGRNGRYNIKTSALVQTEDGVPLAPVAEGTVDDLDELAVAQQLDEAQRQHDVDHDDEPGETRTYLHTEMSEPRQVDVDAIKRALGLARRTARGDKVTPGLGVVELRDGIARGGTAEAMTLVASDLLKKVSLKVDVKDVGRVRSVLHCMQHGYLSESVHAYEFRDQHVSAVIPKAKHSFPPIDGLKEVEPTEKVFVRAEDLFNALGLFAPLLVRHKGKAIAEFVCVAGRPDVLQLNAIVPEQLADKGTALLRIVGEEQTSPVQTDLAIRVSLDMLQQVTSFSGDASKMTGISMFKGGLIMLEEGDEDMQTRTYLAKIAS